MIRLRRGLGHPTWGATWLDIGRLRLIRCARHPSSNRALDPPNKWMIVWRRRLPEWNPRTKWAGSDEPGPYFKDCIRRALREPGYPLTGCKFPKCDCGRGEQWERRRAEFERREAEGAAYREAWILRQRQSKERP